MKVKGLENIDPKRPAIYMANHTTVLDIPILVAALPVDIRFIFKKSLAYIPIVGWAMMLTGMVPIERGTKGPALKSLRVAANKIKKGMHVIIFPEGTRTRTGKLGKLKKGGFLLASLSETAIVPVHISDTSHLCKRNIPLIKPGHLTVTIHPAIIPDSNTKMTSRDNIDIVESLLKQ